MGFKRAVAFCSLLILAVLLAVNLPLSLGEWCCTPCSVVDKLTIPTLIEAGKSFAVVSALTVWCYGFLSEVRVDLVDANSNEILSTASLPLHYSQSGSYIVSVADNLVARNAIGSWALVIQAYVIDRDSGFSIGHWLQLLQVIVLP